MIVCSDLETADSEVPKPAGVLAPEQRGSVCLPLYDSTSRNSTCRLAWRCGSIDPVETNVAGTGLPYSLNNGQCMTVIETDLYPYLRETELCTENQSEVELLCFNV